MRTNNFVAGATYKIKMDNWESPNGELVQGKTVVRKVLEPANINNTQFTDGAATKETVNRWQTLLRVQNLESGHIHFLDPTLITSAEVKNNV